MPPTVTAYQLGEALLDAVQCNSYPESEAIISADFPPSAFPQALELLSSALEEVKVHTPSTRLRSSHMLTCCIDPPSQVKQAQCARH